MSILQARLALADKDYPAAIEVLEAVKAKTQRPWPHFFADQAEIGFLLSRAYDKLIYMTRVAAAADAHTAKPEVIRCGPILNPKPNASWHFFTRDRMRLHRASEKPVEPLLVMGNVPKWHHTPRHHPGDAKQLVRGELSIGSRLQNKLEPL